MNRINLIPTRCLSRARVRLHMRTALSMLTVWGILTGSIATFCWFAYQGAAGDPVASRLEKIQQQITQTQDKTQRVKLELAEVRSRWEANRSVSEQPDWGVLLSLLSDKKDKAITLTAVRLHPITETITPPKKTGRAVTTPEKVMVGYRVSLDGLASSQDLVSRYLIELERTGVMTNVVLIESRLEKINGASATAFHIECELRPTEEVSDVR